ncbi:hypothetical protein [Streptomyces xinghaiensis]|uniref:hypothetical protein n=1 Tax=Streptomyces xinghaiensis TaxID=1038928 RepID=UPI0003058449|nr:hypothetical protein [Streptomyces xinghaiensis]MZE79919.1 hypothetical protein [Streptomyces sp. SID5475]
MSAKSTKLAIPLAALLAVALGGTAAYVLGVPPFEERGDIGAESVCESLGDPEKAAPALERVLPDSPEYSFDDTVSGGSVAQGDSNYTADCFVSGNGKILLSARTELVPVGSPGGTPEDWASEALDGSSPEEEETFAAGSKGVVSADRAAVLVPCAGPGNVPGGSYSLSVVVDGKGADGESGSRVRRGLTDLAVGAAQFSHEKAGCDLPSELPS